MASERNSSASAFICTSRLFRVSAGTGPSGCQAPTVWRGEFQVSRHPPFEVSRHRPFGALVTRFPDTHRLGRWLPDTHRLARGILIAANHSEWGCLEPRRSLGVWVSGTLGVWVPGTLTQHDQTARDSLSYRLPGMMPVASVESRLIARQHAQSILQPPLLGAEDANRLLLKSCLVDPPSPSP
jgi:hypothetical protein